MSRYYEALTEAGKSADADIQGQPEIAVEEGEPCASVQPQSPAAPALKPVGMDLKSAVSLDVPTGVNGSGEAAKSELFTATTREPLQFGPWARVIPNASRRVVLEQYRKLRTKLLAQNQIRPFHTLAITSPGPREGKTITALNLGLCFGMLPNFRVLVVDGDVRRGGASAHLGAKGAPGLSNVIEGTAGIGDVIFQYADIPVHVMMSGNSTVPPELLFSSQIEVHLRRMAELYDLVIVDTPPVNLVADTQMIASKCDAALLIARAFSTTRKSLEKAIQELNGVRIVGTVLNSGTRAQVYRGYGYGGYY